MKVAVVIPAYNRADLIGDTLQSVMAQTRLPDAVIVVDDGSTDNTGEVVRDWTKKTSGLVRYVFRPNGGLPAARNTALPHLAPDVDALLFLDSDDCLVPDALSRLEAALTANPDAPLAFGRPRPVNCDGTPTGKGWEIEDADGQVYDRLLFRNFICTAGCVLLRRAPFEQAGAWDESLNAAEDWDMWLRLAEVGPLVRVLNGGPVCEYRLHPNNKSKNLRETHAYEMIIYEKHLARARQSGNTTRYEKIAEVYDEVKKRAASAQAQGLSDAETRLSPRHRLFRRILGGAGLAKWYQKLVPYSVRLKLRSLLGVDRWA